MGNLAAVGSVEDECRIMGRCGCRGEWMLTYNEVSLQRRVWVDIVVVRCATCGLRRTFEFDITGFFEPRPGVWRRTLVAQPLRASRLRRFRYEQPSAAVRASAA